ncbi:unnamed protein product [Paramecium primaurelia]|uniref:CP-type G domain-containing protein n=1 Tax=Paramecium primaurelia TaxID=5886 RepID=A0A8S1LWX0_PARPR|nr:unnamed protein product [Paramecium primaurelia]
MVKRSKEQFFKKKMNTKFKSSQKGSKSGASTNPDRKLPEKQLNAKHQFFRSKQTIQRLNLYNEKPNKEEMWKQATQPARVDPNRKWFGNIRTIDQQQLDKLRQEMANRTHDPRSVLIKAKQLPLSLLVEAQKKNKNVPLLELESYEDTYGPKSKRKRIKLNVETMEGLADHAQQQEQTYVVEKDEKLNPVEVVQKESRDKRLTAGQSKRIWEELYKVIDSSDVLVCILDSRDPMGTRSYHLENHIKKNCPHKHLVMLINKCDLIPTWLTSRWVQYLSKEYPTVAYHANVNKAFGKGPFINLLRQFDKFHRDKQTISIGFVGYPNVGKSSVINSLKKRKVCKAAPVPGETRVWQYVALTKRIYLIDCPGVVYQHEGKDDVEVVLKGCVRAEKLEDPEYYIPALLEKAKASDLKRIYDIDDWIDEHDFLKKVAIKKGKLAKGGEADTKSTAKLILMDWQRGEIPFLTYPPDYVQKEVVEENIDIEDLEKQQIELNDQKLQEILKQN